MTNNKIIYCSGTGVAEAQEKILPQLLLHNNSLVLWIAPTTNDAKESYAKIGDRLAPFVYAYSKLTYGIDLVNGSRILFKSVSYPEQLRGYKPTLVVLQDAAKIDSQIWAGIIEPMIVLMDDKTKE